MALCNWIKGVSCDKLIYEIAIFHSINRETCDKNEIKYKFSNNHTFFPTTNYTLRQTIIKKFCFPFSHPLSSMTWENTSVYSSKLHEVWLTKWLYVNAGTPPPLLVPAPLDSSMEATLCAFCSRLPPLVLLRRSSGGSLFCFKHVGLIQTPLI